MPLPKTNQNQIENLASLRRVIVRRMLKIVVSFTPFVLAFGIYRAVQAQAIVAIVIFALAYSGLLVATFNKNIPYTIQAALLVFVSFAVGVQDLLSYGLSGTGSLFLLTAIFFASSFYNWRVGFTIIGFAALVLALLGSLISGMTIEIPIERLANSLFLSAWYTRIIVFLLLGGINIWGLHYLLSRLDASLKHSRQLAQTLAESHLELEEALTRATELAALAKQASEAKSEFLANMSHELRTPLNSILGYAQIIKGQAGLSREQREGLGIIYHSGEHLLTLINEILDLSKIEAGKLEIIATPVMMQPFLSGIVGIMRMQAQEKGLAFVWEIEHNLPATVSVDEKRLRQVLINLLGNAVKFTDSGQVTLKIKRLPDQSQSDATKPISKLRFEVSDTGIGISQELLQSIFLPFEQVADKKRNTQGTGLGLAITQRLVSLMGSQVHLVSELGKGSTFYFELSLPIVGSDVKDKVWIDVGTQVVEDAHHKGSEPFVLPPLKELLDLYQLAMLGNIRRLNERLIYLSELDEAYVPFANQLHQLAQKFEDQKILTLIEKYMQGEQVNHRS